MSMLTPPLAAVFAAQILAHRERLVARLKLALTLPFRADLTVREDLNRDLLLALQDRFQLSDRWLVRHRTHRLLCSSATARLHSRIVAQPLQADPAGWGTSRSREVPGPL